MSVQALKVALGVSLARKFTLWEMTFTLCFTISILELFASLEKICLYYFPTAYSYVYMTQVKGQLVLMQTVNKRKKSVSNPMWLFPVAI